MSKKDVLNKIRHKNKRLYTRGRSTQGGRSTRYSYRLYDFSVTILRCYKDVNSFSSRTARLSWNYLPIECFLLTYNLNG